MVAINLQILATVAEVIRIPAVLCHSSASNTHLVRHTLGHEFLDHTLSVDVAHTDRFRTILCRRTASGPTTCSTIVCTRDNREPWPANVA